MRDRFHIVAVVILEQPQDIVKRVVEPGIAFGNQETGGVARAEGAPHVRWNRSGAGGPAPARPGGGSRDCARASSSLSLPELDDCTGLSTRACDRHGDAGVRGLSSCLCGPALF